jgi:Bacterial PH domain
MAAPSSLVVTARPVRSARVGYVCAVIVLVIFAITAGVMPTANAGASFNGADQVATAIIGVILAGLLTIPARPRLVADRDGVHIRQFLGEWRTVPWDLIVAVEFPARSRVARVVLPGDEVIGLYAVQRWDAERSVAVMAGLRTLFDASRQAG